MSDRPDTWMPMYWGDYLKDTGHLGTLEHGAYLLLIGHYWSTGGALPDNDGALANIARLPLAKWKAMRDTICRFFAVADGVWRHGRLEREIAAAIERKAKAKDRAEHAAAKRWAGHKQSSGDAPSIANGMHEQCPSSSPSSLEPKGSKARRGTPLPKDWKPTQEELEYARAHGSSDPADTAERFRLHHVNKGTLGKDWHAGFQFWCRNEKNFRSAAPASKFSKPDAQTLPPAEEWGARMNGYKPGGFWLSAWGPPPGEPGCRVPPAIYSEWAAKKQERAAA